MSSGLRGYSDLLGPSDRRVLFVAGLLARTPLALIGFSVLFFVRATSGSFASAGFASGIAVAAMACVSPFFGRVADRRGQRGALLVAAVGHPVAVVLLIATGRAGAPLPVVCIGAVLVGATVAPVGAFMRARWTGILQRGVRASATAAETAAGSAAGAASVQVAFSLEAIADELVWIFGPALASLVAGTIDPAAGLVLSGIIGTVGSLWLRRGGEVAVAVVPDRSARHSFRPWRSRRLVAVLASSAAVGLAFGVNDVTVVSWTTSIGAPEIAGLVLTAYSIGSATGGFVMGMVPERWPAYRLFLASTVLFGIFWSILALSPSPAWLFPLGVLAGATITPFGISSNRVLHEEVSPQVFTEGLAWVGAFIVGAMAFGSFVGGVVAETQGPSAGFGVVSILAPLPFVIVAAIRLTQRRDAAERPGLRQDPTANHL